MRLLATPSLAGRAVQHRAALLSSAPRHGPVCVSGANKSAVTRLGLLRPFLPSEQGIGRAVRASTFSPDSLTSQVVGTEPGREASGICVQ